MTRCVDCHRFISPWNKQGPPLLRPLHRACWHRRYETRLASWRSVPGLLNSLTFWDDVLMSPSAVSEALMALHEERIDAELQAFAS